MKIYLLCEGEGNTGKQQVHAFFFKRNAMNAAKARIGEGGKWEPISDHETSAIAFWGTASIWMSVVPLPLWFCSWSLRAWISQHFHWQNLNDKKGGTQGSGWKHGRAWFHRRWNEERGGYGKRSRQICFSWSFQPRRWLGYQMDLFDGDNRRDIGFSLHLGIAHFYITLENFLSKNSASRHDWAHETGIILFEDHLQVNLHHAGSDCWNCKGWKGWRWSDFVSDLIWGSAKYSETLLTECHVALTMPEGDYPISVKLVEATWRRPRKPWLEKLQRAKIDCERGIPHPGKGENSWDCGDDATYGLTCPATSVEEAIDKLRETVMRNRERYGGKNWMPANQTS